MSLLLTALISLAATAGQQKLSGSEAVSFRRLFSVCESPDAKCAAQKCKLSVSALKCERIAEAMKGSCTFKCNRSEHILTGDQALSVFKAVESQKKMIEKTDKSESFKDASVSCPAMKSEAAATCSLKHAKIK